MRAIPCAAPLMPLLVVVVLLLVAPWRGGGAAVARALNFTRADFPGDFVFGAGTSAYQYEGATGEDGRSASIWDTFTHAGDDNLTSYGLRLCASSYLHVASWLNGCDPSMIMLVIIGCNFTIAIRRMPDKSTGDLGADGYHRYKEDVELMSDAGLEAYRFSISWSRLIPRGRGPVNPKGLEYYNNLINELTRRGIQIHVTLYHLDFPQILEDEYHGWLSPRVVDDFTAFADACFREFGDRVRHWTTMDEPNVIAIAAYDSGAFPPCRCSAPYGMNCTTGDSTVEPYTVAHHSILAHAAAVRLYRDKILDPLVKGDYPEIMKKKAGSRIPSFTKEQSELIRGAIDFVGINHYTSVYVSDGKSGADASLRDYNADMSATFRMSRNDSGTGQFIPINMPNDPQGLQCYGQFFIDSVNDHNRVEYLSGYIGSTLAALRNGANVKGYFVWSFLDVFEFMAGYYSRYGLHYVDFQDPELPRQPKLSAKWYSKFLKSEIGISIEKMVSPDTRSHAQQ
ncbi:unnamed protein product [Triticum turgidum subsp. durum]|uniref:4-hydroxy-7-methoxy-3-oxo-3,4-dihydro-2H-1,4-benzoxazin-2-yl glucosidebeta-D-glucosidase n=1 Tax=Triticum turgidum subsp. durum TaxID=4567 RepID=A0A9R0UZI2_TRITD|nr:unnamed protein product [Triticum turgidum subsp. durum]